MSGLSLENPTNLFTAFTGKNIIPGDEIVLRSGTYSYSYVNQIVGSFDNPVIIKPYNHERVIINGGFTESSEYITYIDIEFSSVRNPNPDDFPDTSFHDFRALGGKYINCIFHDSNGAGCWDNVDLVYGCISYNHGYIISGSMNYGHSLYTQNQDTNHNKTIKHSIFGRSANFGLHGYATQFNLENLHIVGCVLLPGSSHLLGSQKSDDNIQLIDIHSYGSLSVGYGSHDHTNILITGSILYHAGHPLQLTKWESGNIIGNILVSSITGSLIESDVMHYQPPTGSNGLNINNNVYYSRTGKSSCFATDGVPPYWMDINTWNSLYGFDGNSVIFISGSSPNDSIYVYPNEYASISKRKGMIIIHNWTKKNSVDVDISSLPVSVGNTYSLRQAQNPIEDIRVGVVPDNNIITINMSGTIASVSGWNDPVSTFPEFGAFMLEIT